MNINWLPSNAKMVFRWKKYEVWQWEQTMYDGSVKIFEKVRWLDTVTVIALVDDMIILQKQEQPYRWTFLSLPWWWIEDWESPIDSIKRELLEETWYSSDDIILWKNIPSYYSSLIRDSYYFIAKNCKKVQDLDLDNWEKIENQLMSFWCYQKMITFVINI